MENLSIQKPKNALEELRHLMIPSDLPGNSTIQLVIRINAEDISIRDFSAFLDLIDDIHGRLSPNGLRSYARREFGHLKISKFQEGSWELIIEKTLSYVRQSEILLVIWLVLKYLPQAFQTFASAYNDYEQGRLARENRKRIKMQMEKDEKLRTLSPRRRADLITLIDILYSKESVKLPRASRFARRALLDVEVRVSKRSKKQQK
jgi:hypothetical protein